MEHINSILMAIIAGAERAAWGDPYEVFYRVRIKRGQPAVWPVPGSKLAQLVEALGEPGAMDYLHRHLQETLTPTISNDLRNMPYAGFLGTRYWWIVKGLLVSMRGNRCEECGSLGILDAHHLTYAHRGSEVFHLDELRLLCRVDATTGNMTPKPPPGRGRKEA